MSMHLYQRLNIIPETLLLKENKGENTSKIHYELTNIMKWNHKASE